MVANFFTRSRYLFFRRLAATDLRGIERDLDIQPPKHFDHTLPHLGKELVTQTRYKPTICSLARIPLDRDAHHRALGPLRVADGHSGRTRIHDAHRCQGNPDVIIPPRHFHQRARMQIGRSREDFVTSVLQADHVGRVRAVAFRLAGAHQRSPGRRR